MFQARMKTLQKSLLHPTYYTEEFIELEVFPPFEIGLCYFVGSVEDFDIFKGWLFTQGNVNVDEVVRLESLDSPELSPTMWGQTTVTYFTKVDPCSHTISTKIP